MSAAREELVSMPGGDGARAGAGGPPARVGGEVGGARRLPPEGGLARPMRRRFSDRVGWWLIWWVVLMAFWVALDYSLDTAELLVGAGVAALVAFAVELVGHQSDTRFRPRWRWLARAAGLPGRVFADTIVVFAALGRRLLSGEVASGGFVERGLAWGDESAVGATRRVLLIGATSLAPNTVVLGFDRERGVLTVHHLVPPGDEDPGGGRR